MTTAMSQSNGNALARPPQQAGPGRLAGAEAKDLILPRVHIMQGLPAERKQYGNHEPGTLVNTLTGEKIEGLKFVPISGWKEWIKWNEPRGSGMEYRTRNKADVPTADLEWNDNEPPAVTEYINWAVMFEGESFPLVLSFSSTAIKAGQTIETLQAIRGNNKGPGFYALELKEKSNDKGAWLSPQIRPLGDPPAELAELAGQMFDSFSGRTIDTNTSPEGA